MKKSLFGAALLSLGIAASLSSCSQENRNPVGVWTSAAPERVADSIDNASATRTLTFDFQEPVGNNGGNVTLTANYDVTPAATDSVATPYKAIATISGKWSQDTDDRDDLLLSFDTNTLSVSGIDAPYLGPVTDAFVSSLSSFTNIEDVEVSKDKTHLTFETKQPEVKYHLVAK